MFFFLQTCHVNFYKPFTPGGQNKIDALILVCLRIRLPEREKKTYFIVSFQPFKFGVKTIYTVLIVCIILYAYIKDACVF